MPEVTQWIVEAGLLSKPLTLITSLHTSPKSTGLGD